MKPQRIGDIFSVYLKKSPIGSKLKANMALFYWPQVVGEPLASKVVAVSIQNGILLAKTDNPMIAQEMAIWKNRHLSRLQKILGKGLIRDIRINVGSMETPSSFGSGVNFPEVYQESAGPEPEKPTGKDPVERLKEAQERLTKYRRERGWRACPGCNALSPPVEGGLCYYCRLSHEQDEMQMILANLSRSPWLNWEEWQKEYPGSKDFFIRARRILLDRWRNEIHSYKGAALNKEEIKKVRGLLMKYLMLFEGRPMDAWPENRIRYILGKELYEKCFEKGNIEVRNHVSSPG